MTITVQSSPDIEIEVTGPNSIAVTVTTGLPGPEGADGFSAYEIAVSNGFVGSEAQWLASLVGADGADGTDGMDGSDGNDGPPGPSTPSGDATNLLSLGTDSLLFLPSSVIAWGAITGTLSDQTDLQTALDLKALADHTHNGIYSVVGHTHAISDTTGLQTALDGKAATSHEHDAQYASLGHNHDASYSALGHTHSVYADLALSNLASYSTARNNLGLGTADTVRFAKLGLGTAAVATLDVASASGGANTGLNMVQLANGTANVSYIPIDFTVPTSGLIGQFLATANNYSNAGLNLPANSMALLAEATSGVLLLGGCGASGEIRINTGGYAVANERIRILAGGNIGVRKTTADEAIDVNGNVKATSFIGNLTGGTASATALNLTGSAALTTIDSASAEPSTPAAGKIAVYARPIAGRQFLKMKGPSGLDFIFQPGLFGNAIGVLAPGSGSTPTQFGLLSTTVGTVSTPIPTSTNLKTSMRRIAVTSAATNPSASEMRSAVFGVWRGNAAGLGGWFYSCRFSHSSTTVSQRLAVGLWGSASATSTSQVPSSLTNCIFAGWDSADTNLQIMHNDAADACTKVDLGASFPANTAAAAYEFQMFAVPNGSTIEWQVTRLDTGSVATGTISTDMPASTQFLAWHMYMNNGPTAAAVALEVMRLYLESDY